MSTIILDTPTHQIRTADGATVGPAVIRRITTQAFFRRLSSSERATLRNQTADAIVDIREDLQRGSTVNLDRVGQRMTNAGLSAARVAAITVDGTSEEQ